MMITAVVIDDEVSNVENMNTLIGRYCPGVSLKGSASSVVEGIELIERVQPDLVFLDIQLGQDTGFDLLKKLKEIKFDVIFITAYDSYGIEAIKFSALDYLLKPVDIPELVKAVNKAAQQIRLRQQAGQLSFLLNHIKNEEVKPARIALPQLQEIRYVNVSEIIRCQADNTYTTFYLQNGNRVVVSKPIREYADILKPLGFLRTHQSHLVNPSYVKSWIREDGGLLLLNNGDKVPVSKPNKAAVQAALSC